MKKVIVALLAFMFIIDVHGYVDVPRFEIIANTNDKNDVKYMYEVKSQLLNDYKDWSKGVDNEDQVLYDHTDDYQAIYKNRVYKIVLGKGQGKSISGEMKVNYCEKTEDIKVRSFFFDWLF